MKRENFLRFSLIFNLVLFFWLNLAVLFSQNEEEISKKLIKEYTTDPSFLNSWVDYIPFSKTVPTPYKVLGYINGTPGKLTYYDDIYKYFKILADKSDNVEFFLIGKTDEGNEMFVVAIADSKTIKSLKIYRDYSYQLSDPRKTDEVRAKQIIKKAKPIYYLTGGLHSAETGSPEMLTELAYRLAVSDDEKIKKIRENIITLITPVLEIDGWQRQVDWYYRHTKKIEKIEDIPMITSPFWGKYVFHDNNRDGIQISQKLTKNLYKAFFNWYPQVTHDLHESLPLLYVSTGYGPYNPNLDPISTQEWQWIAQYEVTELTKLGMPGVWTWAFFDGWYPGYLLWLGNNYNAIGRFYETFGNAGANTYERELKEKFMGKPVTTKEWYRAYPPPKKVKWSLRNNINYMQSGVIAALYLTALNKETILYNFWKKGFNSYMKGKTEPPYAWVIPSGQKNINAVYDLLNLLLEHRIEVHKANEKIKLKDKEFPEGSFVVRMDQPYRNHAKNLLEIQEFPKDAATIPYDDTGWTLGFLYGVATEKIDDPDIQKISMSPVEEPLMYRGKFIKVDNPNFYIVKNNGSNTMISARYGLKKYKIFVAEKEFTIKNENYLAGTWIIPVKNNPPELENELKEASEKFGLEVSSLENKLEVPHHELDLPRIGVYHTWLYPQDAGWVHFTFDKAGIPYNLINDERLREGNLKKDFDVIILPNQWGNLTSFLRGISSKYSPIAYNKTKEFKHLGEVDSSDDITGGMKLEGFLTLEKFIVEGGVLIALDNASRLPIELGFVDDISLVPSPKLQLKGAIVKGETFKKEHPILYGCPEEISIFKGSNSMFKVSKKALKYIVLQYGTKEPIGYEEQEDYYSRLYYGDFGSNMEDGLDISEPQEEIKKPEQKSPVWLSGLVKNEQELDGKVAIMDVPFGNGHVVLFNFNPLYRYMNQCNFNFVYNAILNYNDMKN
ncbi:MAG: M14 family zinc carboxypeptidase [Acidobacteriota bacterium]